MHCARALRRNGSVATCSIISLHWPSAPSIKAQSRPACATLSSRWDRGRSAHFLASSRKPWGEDVAGNDKCQGGGKKTDVPVLRYCSCKTKWEVLCRIGQVLLPSDWSNSPQRSISGVVSLSTLGFLDFSNNCGEQGISAGAACLSRWQAGPAEMSSSPQLLKVQKP